MKALLFFCYTKLIIKGNLNLDMVVHVCISQLYVTATKIPEATNFIKRNSLEPYMDYLDHTPQSQGASQGSRRKTVKDKMESSTTKRCLRVMAPLLQS